MMAHACIETKVEATSGSPAKSDFHATISQLRRLVSQELGCEHDELVFDEINDVHCKQCGKDFTG